MNDDAIPGRKAMPLARLSNALGSAALLVWSATAFALPPGPTPNLDPLVAQTNMALCQSKYLARLDACQQIGVRPLDPYSDAVFAYPEPSCAAAAQAKYENCLAKPATVRAYPGN